jgi:hypothetical protein
VIWRDGEESVLASLPTPDTSAAELGCPRFPGEQGARGVGEGGELTQKDWRGSALKN